MQELGPKEIQNPDFIKMANIMKDELDLITYIEDKEVYGLLVEGIDAGFLYEIIFVKHCYRIQMPAFCHGSFLLQSLPSVYDRTVLFASLFV